MATDYSGRPPVAKKDTRPPCYGWAPGDYYCTCVTCGDWFIGDKRAVECADCVYGKLAEVVG